MWPTKKGQNLSKSLIYRLAMFTAVQQIFNIKIWNENIILITYAVFFRANDGEIDASGVHSNNLPSRLCGVVVTAPMTRRLLTADLWRSP